LYKVIAMKKNKLHIVKKLAFDYRGAYDTAREQIK